MTAISATAQPADLARENAELRHLLAVRVAGALLYADDGELQDASELPAIDFKRDAPGEIARKLTDRGLKKLTKPERVHALVNAGPYPGMSDAFDAHMGAACWTDPVYRQDAATWAAAWKAALSAAEAAPKQEAGAELAARLREAANAQGAEWDTADSALMRQAADEIERMRAAISAQPQQPAPEPVARVPLNERQMLDCVRSVGTPAPMGLTRDRGPYEITEPTWFLIQLVRAIERAHGISAPQTPATPGAER